jgi:hypothetical protein
MLERIFTAPKTPAQLFEERAKAVLDESERPKTLGDVRAALAALEEEETALLAEYARLVDAGEIAAFGTPETRQRASEIKDRQLDIRQVRGHLGRRERALKAEEAARKADAAMLQVAPLLKAALTAWGEALRPWLELDDAVTTAVSAGADATRLPKLPPAIATEVREYRRWQEASR